MTEGQPPPVGEIATAVAELQDRFARFAAVIPDLPLYRRLAEGAAEDPAVAGLLTSARPGQARPVLLLAAVHDLVLRERDAVAAARWFPSVGGSLADGDPWPDVRRTVLTHEEELRATIAARTTQTNEVNRVVYLAALLAAAAADRPDRPVALLELGASAGLLLGIDRYRIDLQVGAEIRTLGSAPSPVHCAGEVRGGRTAPTALPRIAARLGLDAAPVPLGDVDSVRWLEACLWPDQMGRLEGFRRARDLLAAAPPLVVAGDMVGDLPDAIEGLLAQAPGDGSHLVVTSSWALTYVERARRPDVATVLAEVAAAGWDVSWATAEPAGCVPGLPDLPAELVDPEESVGQTVLGLRRWRSGTEVEPAVTGVAHPHGEWVHLV